MQGRCGHHPEPDESKGHGRRQVSAAGPMNGVSTMLPIGLRMAILLTQIPALPPGKYDLKPRF